MKFEILQEELLKGLTTVARAVASRPQIPVLSNVLIEAKHDGIMLSTTDLELGMRVKILGKVETEGVVTVPAKTLQEFVATILGKVEIKVEKESLVIRAGSSVSRLQTVAAEEFPRLPELPTQGGCEMGASELSLCIGVVLYASAKDSLRPVLTGVLLEKVAGGVKLVATDGFRLSLSKMKTKGTVVKEKYLIPARALLEVARMATGGVVTFVQVSESQVAFVFEGAELFTQLIEGNFPDYQKIVPETFETEVITAREELLLAVKTMQIFARENSNMVTWEVGENLIKMRSESPERGEATVEVACATQGEGGKIVFNTKFLLDFLQNSQAESIWYGMGDNLKPGAFREKGSEDSLYIVMPINA